MEHAKFEILAATSQGLLSVEEYIHITAGLSVRERGDLQQWIEDCGLDFTESLSMSALYHCDLGRQYRPTRQEKESGKFSCPACKEYLRRVTRKAKDVLFRCPICAWAIAQSDIYSDGGRSSAETDLGESAPW